MLATLVALGGCMATTGSIPGKGTVTVVEGPYDAPKSTALPNDIKTILAAGGLDVTDPSAPVKGTKVAELATSSRSKEVQSLVAKLEDGPAEDASKVAAAQPGPAPRKGTALSLLSLAGAQKKTEAQDKVALPARVEFAEPQVSSVTFTYPEIRAGASVEEPQAEPLRAPAPKASPKRARLATASAPSQPKVKRF